MFFLFKAQKLAYSDEHKNLSLLGYVFYFSKCHSQYGGMLTSHFYSATTPMECLLFYIYGLNCLGISSDPVSFGCNYNVTQESFFKTGETGEHEHLSKDNVDHMSGLK